MAQFLASFAANLGQMGVGHSVPVSSFLLPQLVLGKDDLVLTPDQGSWFASIFVVGALIGSLVGSYQSDILGRRLSMMVDCLLMSMGLLTISLAPSTLFLILGRLLIGLAAGSNLVSAPIFVCETSHPTVRGITSTLTMVCYTGGFFSSMLLGALLPWRLAVGLFMVTPLCSVVLLICCKESPTWLLKKGREDQALESLMFYRGDMDQSKQEMMDRKSSLKSQISRDWRQTFRRVMSPEFLRPFLLLNVLRNIGLEWGGFPVLAFYTHTLLQKISLPVNEYWMAVILAGYRFIMTVCLSLVMYWMPKRPMYLCSGFIVLIGLSTLSVYNWLEPYLSPSTLENTSYLSLIGVVLMFTGFGLGYGSIVFILQGEILPADVRGLGSGLLGILDNISLFVSVKLAPTIMSSMGLEGAFGLYSVCCLFTLVTAAICMPETKGLSLEDIERHYKKKDGKPL